MARDRGLFLIAALLVAAPFLSAAEDEYGFMPPGGRALLADLLAEDPAALAEAAGQAGDRAEWQAWLAERQAGLDDRAKATLAAYAALNFPLDEAARASLAAGNLSALPPDGRDLAVGQCQFCHSLFTGYLMQRRDETSWLGTFKAPFHQEIPMDETQRATFAAYSAINMPLTVEDVPPELRF